MATVRYLVTDIKMALSFYINELGFTLKQQFGTAMAIVEKDGLQLWLAGQTSSAAQPMPDGRQPAPGGWNRIVLNVEDLPGLVKKLKNDKITFRNDIVKGPGGQQILCEDPSGNVVELFQPA